MADVNFGDVIEDWLAGFPLLTILSYRLGALHSIEVAFAFLTGSVNKIIKVFIAVTFLEKRYF